ncbi:MAG TPA: beta/gamma crystallin-related protein [Caulobacteraceae bacterium]
MKPFVAVALVGLCAAALAGSALSQPRAGGRRAILYEYPNFQGRSYVVYGRNDGLGPTGFEDKAMSGRFEGDWVICEDDDYRGRCATVSGDVRNLDRLGLGRTISSLRATWGGGRGDDDRRGEDYGWSEGGDWRDNGDWQWGGDWRWGGDWHGGNGRRTATLFEYPDFQGRSYTVYGGNRGLGPTGFEDRAMSGHFDGAWVICEDDDFQGRCATVSGDVRNLDRLDLGHSVSSLQATRGWDRR